MMTMAILAIAFGLVCLLFASVGLARRSSAELRERFGSEYDRLVGERGSRKAAERELRSREARVSKLDLRPLNAEQREKFMTDWLKIQAKFVDDPAGAARLASALLKIALQTQGYPSVPFEQRMEYLSVDRARVVEHYRAARALTDEHPEGKPTTEDLRQALVHYRIILEELAEPTSHAPHELRIQREASAA